MGSILSHMPPVSLHDLAGCYGICHAGVVSPSSPSASLSHLVARCCRFRPPRRHHFLVISPLLFIPSSSSLPLSSFPPLPSLLRSLFLPPFLIPVVTPGPSLSSSFVPILQPSCCHAIVSPPCSSSSTSLSSWWSSLSFTPLCFSFASSFLSFTVSSCSFASWSCPFTSLSVSLSSLSVSSSSSSVSSSSSSVSSSSSSVSSSSSSVSSSWSFALASQLVFRPSSSWSVVRLVVQVARLAIPVVHPCLPNPSVE